jgi:hypothetical protein
MKRLSLAICALAMLAVAGVGGAQMTPSILPLALLTKAHEAGSPIEAVEIVDAPRRGLFDRSTSPILQVSRAAYEAATSPEERDALLAIALSHRIGMPRRTPSDVAQVGDALQNVLAGSIDESIASRDRANPTLKLPATQRRWERAPDGTPPRGDQTILRGLAWARAAGVCEKVSVDFLNRLASSEPRNGQVAIDARLALKALGLLRFSPDERC